TLKHNGRVQVRESVCRCGIGEIVRWNIDGLERSDRSFVCRCNSLLQITHLSSKGRLIPNRAWRSAQQRRHFRACLRESKDVVDKKKDVLVALVAKIFGHCKRGKSNA